MARAKQEHVCEICGKTFYYSAHLRTVCSYECRDKLRKLKSKEHNDKRREGRHNKIPFVHKPATDNMKALEEDAYAFYEKAKKYDLLLVPSDSFGFEGYVRISYCVSPSQIERSLPYFKKLIEEYK